MGDQNVDGWRFTQQEIYGVFGSEVRVALPRECTEREIRKQRNRDSAAKSRLAKRQYIYELENRVNELSRTVTMLTKENTFWKNLELGGPYDPTCPLVACAGFEVSIAN